MNKENINTVAHRWLLSSIQPEWIAVDGTAGNGNDTLFLLQHCQKVYAFDIQEAAKIKTLQRCSGYNNLIFTLLSHEHLKTIVQEPIDCAVFNFGYLPRSESSCITQPESSVKAIQAAFDLLKESGVLMLACYLNHCGGQEEHQAIFHWITQQQNITLRSYTQHDHAPILYEIIKIPEAPY